MRSSADFFFSISRASRAGGDGALPAAALLGFSSATPVTIALSIASRSEDIAEDAALLKLLRAIFSARARSADMSAYAPPFGFPAARAFAPASLAVATETPRSPALCL